MHQKWTFASASGLKRQDLSWPTFLFTWTFLKLLVCKTNIVISLAKRRWTVQLLSGTVKHFNVCKWTLLLFCPSESIGKYLATESWKGSIQLGRRSRGRWRSEAVGGAILCHIQVSDFNHLEPVCGGEVLLSTANSPNWWPVARYLISECERREQTPEGVQFKNNFWGELLSVRPLFHLVCFGKLSLSPCLDESERFPKIFSVV